MTQQTATQTIAALESEFERLCRAGASHEQIDAAHTAYVAAQAAEDVLTPRVLCGYVIRACIHCHANPAHLKAVG